MSKLRVAALTAAVIAAAPAPAAAAWAPAADLSVPGGGRTGHSNAIVAAGGRFVAAWAWGAPGHRTPTRVQARRLGNGRPGRTLTLAEGTATVDDVRLWPAPHGRSVVTWATGLRRSATAITLRTIGADDRLGRPVRIAGSGTDVVVVPRADGSTTVAWIDGSAVVRARRISAAGRLGPVASLTAARGPVHELVGAADMDGGVLLVYNAGGTLFGQRILGDGSATRPSFPISPLGQTARAPRLATDGTGGATVLWIQDTTPASVQEVAVIADDKLSGLERLSPPGVAARAPSLAFRNGSGVTVWEARTARGAVVRGLDSEGSQTTLSRPTIRPGLQPQVAIDAAGTGFALWRRRGMVQATCFARLCRPQVATLARAASAHIAATARGRAVAIWAERGPDGTRVRAAEFLPSRSRLADGTHRR